MKLPQNTSGIKEMKEANSKRELNISNIKGYIKLQGLTVIIYVPINDSFLSKEFKKRP